MQTSKGGDIISQNGGWGLTKNITKDYRGERRESPKDHGGSQGGVWLACKRICQTEGSQKGNNYSQGHLSMGGTGGDIFIDRYYI